MSAGPKDAAKDKEEAAAILEMLPRAEWSNPALERQIAAFLSKVDGFDAERFIRKVLAPAIEDFFRLAYYDGGRRQEIIDALKSLIRARRAERDAFSKLHRAGIGAQFKAAPRSRRRRVLDHEEAVAQEFLNRLRGSGHDAARPVRTIVRNLADGWDECGGPAITWNGQIDLDDPESRDAHPFFEMTLMIFEDFRTVAAASGDESNSDDLRRRRRCCRIQGQRRRVQDSRHSDSRFVGQSVPHCLL